MNSKKRDTFFDNLKGMMIVLVVFCHFIEQLIPRWSLYPLIYRFYICTYSFHMPVFIFCSGFFSHNHDESTSIRKAISACLVPYVLFQTIYNIIFFTPGSSTASSIRSLLNYSGPQWTLWYLLSMFIWRIIVRPFNVLRRPMTVSIVLAVYAGLTEAGVFLSLSRTMTFFPFFLAGYLTTPNMIERLRKRSKLLSLFLFTAAMGIAVIMSESNTAVKHIRMATPYSSVSDALWLSVLLRITALLIAFVSIYALISLVSGRKTIFSRFGRYCLPIYLLHSGLIRLLSMAGFVGPSRSLYIFPWAAVAAFILCFLLGTNCADRTLRFVTEFISRLIVRCDSDSAEYNL